MHGVVPCHVDDDDYHGFSSLSLSDFSTMVRGREFVFGTPSASDSASFSGSEGGSLSWSNPSYDADVTAPTHWVVVMATVDDIEDASAKITAVVEFGTTSATFSSVGTVTFGADPALGDLNGLETVCRRYASDMDPSYPGTPTTPSTPLRVSTNEKLQASTSCPDVHVASSHGDRQRSSSSRSTPPRAVSTAKSHCALSTSTAGTGTQSPDAQSVPLWTFPVSGSGATTANSSPAIPQGFHNALNKNCQALYDPNKGYIARLTGEHANFVNLVDFFSNNVTPAAA